MRTSNKEEYGIGTDPTNAASNLVIDGLDIIGTDVVMAWQSASNAEYTLEYSTNLAVNSWIPLMVDQTATPPQNIYSSSAPAAEVRYYRVRGRHTDRWNIYMRVWIPPARPMGVDKTTIAGRIPYLGDRLC